MINKMKFLVLTLIAISLVKSCLARPSSTNNNNRNNVGIVGGYEVVPHSLPYQVGLFIPGGDRVHFCGGSLITPTTVLTAAHCGQLSNNIEVVLGAHRINDHESTQVRVNSSQVIIHPEWNMLLLQNDIAIIHLPGAVELNENINVVPLPKNDSNDYLNDLATASGWGKATDNATVISEVLRAVQMPVGETRICNWYYHGVLQHGHICTSGEGGKSTCNGDSGGPLVASTGELIGITSFGMAFGCSIGFPPVFTRVSAYLDWIEANSDYITH